VPDRASWRALGTGVELLVEHGDLGRARVAVEAILERVDRTYSRFRPDSELIALNSAAGRPVRITPLLAEAIQAALVAAAQTGGLVDPTIGRAIRLAGYDTDFTALGHPGRVTPTGAPPPAPVFERVSGWRVVDLDERSGIVRIPSGVELDLGSTGKAFAADLAARTAAAAGADSPKGGVLVSLGGDIALAGRAPDGGWPILAAEDSSLPADGPGQVIALHDGAIATSSTTVRRWVLDGRAMHHLIDPRTGEPARGPWRTVSVIAATCLEANTAATGAIVMGAAAPAWLEGMGLAARLVRTDGRIALVGTWPVPGIARIA
jgi:FAD:protein FMN transferase